MQHSADLRDLLHSIHRKSYPAYKSLRGEYQFRDYILSIDHVQGDPLSLIHILPIPQNCLHGQRNQTHIFPPVHAKFP